MFLNEFIENLKKKYESMSISISKNRFHPDNLRNTWEETRDKSEDDYIPLFWMFYHYDPCKERPSIDIEIKKEMFHRVTEKMLSKENEE